MARFQVASVPTVEHLKYFAEENTLNNSIDRPQKEPLKFDLDTSLLSPDVAELVLGIQKIAENNLFRWKTFPLNLPQPIAVQDVSEASASTRRKPFAVENLFNIPTWDDLELVSIDVHGEVKHLNSKQLDSIRQLGTFTVASTNFPNQHHTWRLNPWLQQGSEPAMESLLTTLAWAVAILDLTAKERFTGNLFSMKQSLLSLRKGIHRFLDLLFGMPSLQARKFESRLQEERSRYLVAELLCSVHCQEEYMSLCRFIRHHLVHTTNSDKMQEIHQQKVPPLPYIFQTPKGLLVDLRLFSRVVVEKSRPLVNTILQQESKTRWSRQVPESSSKGDGKCNETSSNRVNEEMEDEAFDHIAECLLNSPEINQLGEGIAQLLIDQAAATIAMRRSVIKLRDQFTADLIQAEVDIRLQNPLLSLVKPWMDKQSNDIKVKLIKEYRWKCHEEAIEACRKKSLDQFVYFLSRDLAFLKERGPMLRKELWADKEPTRIFHWDTWTWNPYSWVVKRHFQDNVEVISTHLSDTPTSITNPRNGDHSESQQQPVYTVERSDRRSTNTQGPLWRWSNYVQRAWSWSWNAAYACGYLVPWCSPIGIRALFSSQPFYADLELCQVNGVLCPRRNAYTPTLSSRLASLWRHISKARTEFETTPDTGFMGKGFTRQMNRSWNYGVKGVLCSLLLLLFFPVICILCSAGGVCLAVTAPLWAPLFALFYHVCFILFYDVDNPNSTHSPLLPMIHVVVRDLLIDGLLQPISCLFAALFICPIVALLIAIYGVLRWLLSRTRDSLVYHLVVRPRGRIPASEGCLVKRTAGPGLNTQFYYQISKEQALAAFEARLEADRLVAYRRQTERLIRRPAEEFRVFVQQVFTPFSGASCSTPVTEKATEKSDSATAANLRSPNVAVQLERDTKALLTTLEEKVERRLYELRMPLTSNVLKKIRLSSSDLKMLLVKAGMMMRSFYPGEILARIGISESELWDRYDVEESNWLALAAIFLTEIFSPAILIPLTDSETRIQLQTKGVNLSRYTALFTESADIDMPFEWPLRAFPSRIISLPDVSFFSPMSRDVANMSPPWKKKKTTGHQQPKRLLESWKEQSNPVSDHHLGGNFELLIPLPIPHPVLICLLIYNRHRDVGAISLESESCRLLLRYIQGSTTLSSHKKELSKPQLMLEVNASRSPASQKPLLGSSGSDLATSQPSIDIEDGDYSIKSRTNSLSQHDTLVSIAQDGTLSLVGTLVSEHASVDIDDVCLDQDIVIQDTPENEAVVHRGFGSTLARAADTLRTALLGEKVEEGPSSARNYSAENFELLPSDEPVAASNENPADVDGKKKKFPTYQSASFRSWRMNLPLGARYDAGDSVTKLNECQSTVTSPRPLGLLELSSGLALDRGPAFSPAQFSVGRRWLDQGNRLTPSSSRDSLPFAEEDASMVESPNWDPSRNVELVKQDSPRVMGQTYCEIQSRPSAVLASIEDLSVSIDSQHTHKDITSKLGTQV